MIHSYICFEASPPPLSLSLSRGHSTLEPDSVACDDEQGDQIYSAGLQWNLWLLFLATSNTKEKVECVKPNQPCRLYQGKAYQ